MENKDEILSAFVAAQERLFAATDTYADAKSKAIAASSAETAALNILNGCQHVFDDLILQFKKNAPKGSDWCRDGVLEMTKDNLILML